MFMLKNNDGDDAVLSIESRVT